MSSFNGDVLAERNRRVSANLATLAESTLPYKVQESGELVIIQGDGYPMVHFWPAVNRWYVHGRHVHGDAEKLLESLRLRKTEARK